METRHAKPLIYFNLLTLLEPAHSAEVTRLALRAVGADRFFAPQFVACVFGRAQNSAPGLPQRGSLYLEERFTERPQRNFQDQFF